MVAFGGEFEWLTGALLSFIHEYGYVALFVFIVLETAWIIHFAPSELIIPAAAVVLVTDPVSFAFFVTILTVGAVLGSLLAYYLFGVNGDAVMRRYGHVLRIPESEVERSQAWFRRWGEGLLFWGRVVPVLRTPISIPAGFARTDLRRFTVYSGGGWLAYNVILVWLVYGGENERAPIDYILDYARGVAGGDQLLSATIVACGVLTGGWLWMRRRRNLGR
ncbi:MAG: DedA family protein [Halobacteriota archaeon]